MKKRKIIDCITFFDNKFIFELRFNILKNFVDLFVICESIFDHKNNKKNLNFELKFLKTNKVKYIVMEKPFTRKNDIWSNQAEQREFLLKSLDSIVSEDDYIFFSDPDEIPNPKILENFKLVKKYGIFLQNCYNYKFNLFNPFETPWEGTRVCLKKNLKSIDFMRQKVRSKNLNYNFFRFDKEKNIELFNNGGWHFNNIMDAKTISLKLRTFAHTEFDKNEYYDVNIIQSKIDKKIDLFNRGYKFKSVELDKTFPKYLLANYEKYKSFII